MQRALALLAPLLLLLATGTACGDGGDDSPASSGETEMIEITIADGEISPQAQEMSIEAGQPIELVVKSDVKGEIHVHSDPEHEFEYTPGTTTFPLELDRPGAVDIELHDPETLLARVEVR